MRVKVVLQCTETGDRNYITTKNKRNNLFVALMRFFNKIIKSLNNLLHRLSHHLFLLS
ncbi:MULTISPECIES: 50S ribosomal protein L33 [Anoxybacillus]|uniref:Large ribosomal subunit protein bL33 n=1 Tax=Anoxybacillus flavithermus TaxID=33934 RepID=A0AAX1ZYN8_9BACL|nr:50S ribosomal protein L33 [Anoxybacillus flavithermus]ASA95953.1 50S ribosomal protein L33 [Anoxybacillus flavithermus]MBE2905264.1 50S ribosomal protein L33 [Anoxybacillus flavithermus]MBE2908223.1 50S ribosomal protein L33 [Anoxybacillus flavithermus]MBE2910981.1 50S ribosomal protein L33 [Anoxybacillus flavithermus]MBE2912815.1 50S ribosomal protein L33 [Anoxybacillus flavithermus]